MMDLEINGRYDDAFSHLLLIGLASILEDADERRTCMIWWKERGKAMIRPSDDLSWEDCAEIVQAHARRWRNSPWLNARDTYTGTGNAVATLSPRLGIPESAEKWQLLERNRALATNELQTILDYRYIGALGEPSYWSGDRSVYKPDRGASRWEMNARNGGKTFIDGRLLSLSQTVSSRSIPQIVDGLRGKKIVDEIDKKVKKHFTPTGLRSPSVTDNAQAWCALFGISAFPIMQSTTDKFDSTATFFQIEVGSSFAILPLWLKQWTLDKYRAVARSRALLTVGLDEAFSDLPLKDGDQVARIRSNVTTMMVKRSRLWLKNKGVEYCMLFPQYVEPAKKVPNRWLMKGHPVFLEETGTHYER